MALRIHLSIFLPLTLFVSMGVFLVVWCAQQVGASTLCYEAFTYLHKHVVYKDGCILNPFCTLVYGHILIFLFYLTVNNCLYISFIFFVVDKGVSDYKNFQKL